jgi:hypothetical protein
MKAVRRLIPSGLPAVALAIAMLYGASAFQPPPVTEAILDAEGGAIGQAEIVRLGDMEDQRVNESSGLAFSRRADDILWTHNDSGDGPFLYAFDKTGLSRGIYRIQGATAYDWEDMTSCEIDGVPHLLIADTGDNREIRESCILYLVEEPEVGPDISFTGTVAVARKIEFVYEDGKHDCEAIAVDAEGCSIYLITKKTKKNLPCLIYQLDIPPESTTEPLIARAIGEFQFRKVTAMDMSRDGTRAVVITYNEAFEFERGPDESWQLAFWKPWRQLPVPWRGQGESICYGPESDTLYLTSENTPAPLWRVRILQKSQE